MLERGQLEAPDLLRNDGAGPNAAVGVEPWMCLISNPWR